MAKQAIGNTPVTTTSVDLNVQSITSTVDALSKSQHKIYIPHLLNIPYFIYKSLQIKLSSLVRNTHEGDTFTETHQAMHTLYIILYYTQYYITTSLYNVRHIRNDTNCTAGCEMYFIVHLVKLF